MRLTATTRTCCSTATHPASLLMYDVLRLIWRSVTHWLLTVPHGLLLATVT